MLYNADMTNNWKVQLPNSNRRSAEKTTVLFLPLLWVKHAARGTKDGWEEPRQISANKGRRASVDNVGNGKPECVVPIFERSLCFGHRGPWRHCYVLVIWEAAYSFNGNLRPCKGCGSQVCSMCLTINTCFLLHLIKDFIKPIHVNLTYNVLTFPVWYFNCIFWDNVIPQPIPQTLLVQAQLLKLENLWLDSPHCGTWGCYWQSKFSI